ncbi:MAG: hypothetical protein AB1489_04345 [Acidobacteriota bacterium]
MRQQLVQLRSRQKQQPQQSLRISSTVPSTTWIYKQKLKVLFLTLFYAWRYKHVWASLHRYFLAIITPQSYQRYFKQQLQGECNRCGHCCRILFDCPFLVTEPDGKTHCAIYTTRHAPKICVAFPLNPWDLAEIKRAIAPNQCSFSFVPALTATLLPTRLRWQLGKFFRSNNQQSEPGNF